MTSLGYTNQIICGHCGQDFTHSDATGGAIYDGVLYCAKCTGRLRLSHIPFGVKFNRLNNLFAPWAAEQIAAKALAQATKTPTGISLDTTYKEFQEADKHTIIICHACHWNLTIDILGGGLAKRTTDQSAWLPYCRACMQDVITNSLPTDKIAFAPDFMPYQKWYRQIIKTGTFNLDNYYLEWRQYYLNNNIPISLMIIPVWLQESVKLSRTSSASFPRPNEAF